MNTEQLKTKEEILSEKQGEVAIKYDLGTKLVTGHREKYWNESALSAAQDFASQESNRAVDEFKEKLKRELKNASIWNNPMVNDYNAKAVNEFIDKL